MGSRRLGRQRVFKLNEGGQDLESTTAGSTAGASFIDLIKAQSQIREGALITTEFQIDLGSSKGAAFSEPNVAFTAGNEDGNSIIGVSGSTGAAQICQITVAQMGHVTSGELICVETPTGGENDIDLYFGSAVSSSRDDTALGTRLINGGDWVKGKNVVFDSDADGALTNQYLYLANSGSTEGTYTAGKYVLRLHGFAVFDDK